MPVKTSLLILTLGCILGATPALAIPLDCADLFDKQIFAELRKQQANLIKAEIGEDAFSQFFSELRAATTRALHGLELSNAEAQALDNFSRKTLQNLPFRAPHQDAELALEFLSLTAQKPEQHISIAHLWLDIYLKASSQMAPGAEAALHRLNSAISTAVNQGGWLGEKAPSAGPLAQRMRQHYIEFPELEPILRKLSLVVSGVKLEPLRRIPAPTSHGGQLLDRFLKEDTVYRVSSTMPVAFNSEALSELDLSEGFGASGFWLRPGAEIKVKRAYSLALPKVKHGMASDKVTNPDTGRDETIVYAIEISATDIFYDQALAKPMLQAHPVQKLAAAANVPQHYQGFITPAVVLHWQVGLPTK